MRRSEQSGNNNTSVAGMNDGGLFLACSETVIYSVWYCTHPLRSLCTSNCLVTRLIEWQRH